MRKDIFKGERTLEERVNFIEKVIGRMMLRLHKTTTGIISPQTISTCINSNIESGGIKGDIIKCMLFKGKITRFNIIFNKKPKGNICIEVRSLDYEVGESKALYTNKIKAGFDLDINTTDGCLVAVSIHPVNEEDILTEVWAAMLWTPDISRTKIEQQMIDNLEAKANDNGSLSEE